jgi:hypothetical protein
LHLAAGGAALPAISRTAVAQAICLDGKCATTDRDGHILYTDSDHISIYGASLIVPQFLSIIDGKS